MSRREFTNVDGESRKFWAIERSGASFTVTFGRIGTAGQSRTKEFSSEAECVKAHDKVIAGKVKEGYVETSGQEPAAAKAETKSSPEIAAAASAESRSNSGEAAGTDETTVAQGTKANKRPGKGPAAAPQSADPLLRSLQKRKGKLLAALEAIEGQAAEEDGRLTKVWLQYTKITDEGMAAFADQADIVEFELSPKMTDGSLVHLSRMTKMQKLKLQDMRLLGDGLKHLAGMESLHTLSLFGSEVSEEALSHLPPLPSLRQVNLNSSHATDAALRHLARQTGVTDLALGQALVTGPGLAHLAPLTNLEELSLYGAPLTDEGLPHLTTFKELKSLDLTRTAVTDAGMASLALLPKLEMLFVEWTNITDAAIPDLARCKKLSFVNADETWVTLEGVKQFKAQRRGGRISAKCPERRKAQVVPFELVERPLERVAAPVEESWRRIDTWLEANAPILRKSLRAPARESDLKRLEETIGQKLPDDVRESYLIHDGQETFLIEEDEHLPGVFFGLYPLPLFEDEGVEWCWKNQIANRSEYFEEITEGDSHFRPSSYPAGAVRLAWNRRDWISLFWDGGRCYMAVDLDPGPRGTRGQVISYADGVERWVLAQSWSHFLEDVADELEAGHAAVESPEVADNWYYLKGSRKHLLDNLPEWSKAKLPRDFQEGKA